MVEARRVGVNGWVRGLGVRAARPRGRRVVRIRDMAMVDGCWRTVVSPTMAVWGTKKSR